MAKDYPRSYRVADQVQRELSDLIKHELKDPRVPDMVTVAGVEVSKDLANAKVFVSAITIESEGVEKRNDMVDALNQGSGHLRKLLGGRMRLRAVPALKFFYDEVQQTGSALSSLIDDAVATNTTDADLKDDPFNGKAGAGEAGSNGTSVWKKRL